jgi:hypothetical protein
MDSGKEEFFVSLIEVRQKFVPSIFRVNWFLGPKWVDNIHGNEDFVIRAMHYNDWGHHDGKMAKDPYVIMRFSHQNRNNLNPECDFHNFRLVELVNNSANLISKDRLYLHAKKFGIEMAKANDVEFEDLTRTGEIWQGLKIERLDEPKVLEGCIRYEDEYLIGGKK